MLSSLSSKISGHRRRTLLLTVVFVLIAGGLGGPLAGLLKSSANQAPAGSQSTRVDTLVAHATGRASSPGVILLVRTARGADDAAEVRAVVHRLADVAGIVKATGPIAVARDRDEVLVAGTLSAHAMEKTVATSVLTTFAHDRDVTVGGSAISGYQIGQTVTKDLGFSELVVIPLLIALALVFFRGRAALMPLIVGATTVLGTFLVLRGVDEIYGLSTYALNLVIGLGLGLSVDYSLFILSRFRDELDAGRSVSEAVDAAMTHAGRTVIFSALTVAFALATLTIFPLGFAISMGIAGAVTALVAALVAILLTPALLTAWGQKLARPGLQATSRRWERLAGIVMRRPGLVALLTAVVMVAVAVPSLSTHWTPVDNQVIPHGQSSRTVADTISRDFPTVDQAPVTVLVRVPRTYQTAVESFAARVGDVAHVTDVSAPRYLGSSTWEIQARASGDGTGDGAQDAVRYIRRLHADVPVLVGGSAAQFVDQQDAIATYLPIAVAVLAVFTFIVLWLMTRSVVLPIKALIMNALTIGVALAPLNFIYDHGRLSGLLNYTPNGGVEPIDFLVAAVLVFALATDYGVFLLGRITEAHDDGLTPKQSVVKGMGQTGRVLTAAAILLAVAIGAFATSRISFIQQIGIATAFGVLVDALIVRSLLVPSLMALLGDWNWWSPQPLRHIHQRLTATRQTGDATAVGTR